MLRFLTLLVSWWNGTTIGTNWYTARKGEKVGEDEFGNVYYRTRGGKIDPALGFERRWVIYKGISEASAIPPGWHGWMHHKVDVAPANESYKAREWQKGHQANQTGSAFAYRPRGSLLNQGKRDSGITRPDYEAWSPEK
jgi:NADH:ubiquinone oxidoreductase subunit